MLMETLQEAHLKQRRMMYIILALFVLGWGFTEWKTIFAGLILGSLFGLYNFWILVRKASRYEQAIAEGKKRISLGSALRFASGIAAVAIAMTRPDQFDLISTVIGFVIPYVLFLTERIIYHVRQQ
mgnify:CR=1 FL=1